MVPKRKEKVFFADFRIFFLVSIIIKLEFIKNVYKRQFSTIYCENLLSQPSEYSKNLKKTASILNESRFVHLFLVLFDFCEILCFSMNSFSKNLL